MSLDGRVVLLTGASSGIGEATAWALAREGARVCLAARRIDRLKELQRDLIDQTGNRWVNTYQVDVVDQGAVEAWVASCVNTHGRIDTVVNNAGVMLLGPVTNLLGEWQQMVETNLLGSMYVTHAAVPHMLERGSGDLVFLGSVLGRATEPLSAAYCATKFGVTAFADSLRKELAPSGVRVTVVEPGRVETELRQHITPYAGLADVFPSFPGLDAQVIADSIVFALQQPPECSVSEILIRPTASVL